MALYTESDDWQKFAREQMRNSAQNLQQKQAGLDAAKNQKTQTSLVSALSGLVNGIKERGSDILNTVKNIEKTKYGWLDEIIANNDLKNAQKDDSARRNEIAKKYGFNSYSEAINSDRAGDNFWNEIKASNEQTKSRLKKNTDAYRNSITDVTKVNTNEAKGQALNTIDSVLGLIPGVGGVVANVAGGGISGVGDEYKAAGREGRDVDWSNAGKNALIGAASGVAGSLGGKAVGKVAGKMGGSTIGKLAGSNLAQGTIGGASAGAVGGALGTALNGGTLEDALLAAKEGAKAGAIGGGTMASVMGLGGTALDKIRNRGTVTPQTIEPVDAQIVAKNKIQAPQAKAIEAEIVEPVNNRRGIAIKDFDAGVEEIPVKVKTTGRGAAQINGVQDDIPLGDLFGRTTNQDNIPDYGLYGKSGAGRANDIGKPYDGAEPVQSRGKYIDSVVDRAKANLPESKKTAAQILYDTTNGEYSNAAEMLAGKTMADGGLFGGYANEALADYFPKDLVTAIRNGAREIYGEQTPFDAYGLNSREGLPLLNRQEYYHDRTGKPGASITSEDIPAYMQDRMRNDAGKGRYSSADNESIMREVFGDNMDKEQMYDLYEQLAQTTIDPRIYSDDNLGAALAIDPELNRRATQILADQTRRNIAVQGGPALSDTIPVTDRTTRYTENTLPARTYEQPTARANKVMNAEPTATKATPTTMAEEAPTTRQVAVDPATQSKLERDMFVAKQRQGQALLDQYGTLERPYRRMVGGDPAGVLNTLYDDYGLKTPAEVQFAANHVTGKDGTVSKMTRKLAASAENVPTAISESFVNDILIDNGLNEQQMKSIKSQIQAVMNRTGADGYSDGATTLQAIKNLEGKIRDIKGQSGTYHNMSYEDKCRASALQAVRDELTDRLWANADISKVMTDKNLNELRAMYKDNPTWQNFVDNKLAKAKDGAEMRALMKPLVNGAHIIEGAQMTAGSFAEKVAGAAAKAGSAKGAAKNIVAAGADALLNSEKAKQKRAERYANQAKQAEAQLYGEAPVNTNTSKLGAIAGKAGNIAQGAKNLGNKVAGIANNATASLNNDSLAGINGIRTRNGNPIEFNALGNQAQQFANKQMGKAEAERSQNRLENAQAVANAQNEYDNALADYNAQEANYNAQMAQSQGSNGSANMLDRINRAMELAMQAGDITAYGQLADLYKQAYNIYEMQNPQTKNEGKALSANQSKALAASQQLEQLAQMTPNAGTVASTIPVLNSIVDLTGGNEYANQAEALATTLGYLLSGANIKESEARRIGQSYVPNAFDSEKVRQQKLDRARQLIQSYMSDTGAIQQ